ncbi:MAG: NERD domain-containing protein [Oscillospiraceae bacterium]|nr:NERD domain-containing protein [Oscillospiraceae bacterium]
MLPTVLSTIFVVYIAQMELPDEYEDWSYPLWIGLLFISLMFLAFTGYVAAARKYKVLASGYRGEKALEKIARKLRAKNSDYYIFSNLPIRYKNNRSELDLLIVSEGGILTVEVKNHSGGIVGADNDEFWIHRKFYRGGKITETEMKNPLKQIRRQREILKNVLRSKGIDVWIDSVLFFSSNPSLRVKVDCNIDIVSSEEEALSVIANYECPGKKPTREQCDEIVRILKEVSHV